MTGPSGGARRDKAGISNVVGAIIDDVGRYALVCMLIAGCTPASYDMAIERVAPSSGLATDVVPIRIEGTGFVLPLVSSVDNGATRVGSISAAVGGVPLTDVVWRSDQLLEGSVPAGLEPGFYNVTVQLGDRDAMLEGSYEVTTASVTPLGPWGTPVPVANVMPGVDDPSLTDDRLELYFNASGDIYVTTRPSIASPWGTAGVVAALSVAAETTPEVSPDGLTLFVASDRAGGLGDTDIWVATRADRTAAWGTPLAVTELNSSFQDTSSVMTPDGRAIVMTSQRGASASSDIYTSVRASASDPWMTPVEQTALSTAGHEGSPFLTADGLTVYFDSDRSGNHDIYFAQRASVNDPFPPAIPVPEINTAAREEDPWVSADGRHLVFFSDRDGQPGLWESTR